MTDQAVPAAQPQPAPIPTPQRAYTAPRLTVHGTVETLTQSGGIGGGDASGVVDGA